MRSRGCIFHNAKLHICIKLVFFYSITPSPVIRFDIVEIVSSNFSVEGLWPNINLPKNGILAKYGLWNRLIVQRMLSFLFLSQLLIRVLYRQVRRQMRLHVGIVFHWLEFGNMVAGFRH